MRAEAPASQILLLETNKIHFQFFANIQKFGNKIVGRTFIPAAGAAMDVSYSIQAFVKCLHDEEGMGEFVEHGLAVSAKVDVLYRIIHGAQA